MVIRSDFMHLTKAWLSMSNAHWQSLIKDIFSQVNGVKWLRLKRGSMKVESLFDYI